MRAIWVDSDTVFELDNLRNTLFGDIDDTASVELTIYEDDQVTPVAGTTWPVILQGIGDGRYVNSLGLDLIATRNYYANYEVTGTRGEKAEWMLKCTARVRDG